jgi:hypothetical protein
MHGRWNILKNGILIFSIGRSLTYSRTSTSPSLLSVMFISILSCKCGAIITNQSTEWERNRIVTSSGEFKEAYCYTVSIQIFSKIIVKALT